MRTHSNIASYARFGLAKATDKLLSHMRLRIFEAARLKQPPPRFARSTAYTDLHACSRESCSKGKIWEKDAIAARKIAQSARFELLFFRCPNSRPRHAEAGKPRQGFQFHFDLAEAVVIFRHGMVYRIFMKFRKIKVPTKHSNCG